ncbi:MAG: hypothetical protein KIT48_05380 [Pseudolabrys sp.]|nr:hypothetical protein [Pseudolabrys sp.]
MRMFIAALVSAVALSGCAYKADPIAAPSYNVVTSFSSKIPGKWLLAVDGASLNQTVKPSGMACAAHNFPLELRDAFKSSISQTLKNVFDEIEEVPEPIPGDQVTRRGARGLIVVRGEEARGRLDVQPGFWTANMKTEVVIVASTFVDGPSGRIFGTTVEGHGIADAEAGMMCEGGAKSLVSASSIAMRDAVRKAAEALGNSERLRSAGTVGKRR